MTGLEVVIPGICSLRDRAGDEDKGGPDGGDTDRSEFEDGLRACGWSGRANGAGETERGLERGPIGLGGVGIDHRCRPCQLT